jgi:hypothetical protein
MMNLNFRLTVTWPFVYEKKDKTAHQCVSVEYFLDEMAPNCTS